jgi:HD-GYP domain-containing protein (c-di-GMP phosphodiesterase class II)
MTQAADGGVRIAELVATLSYAADLGLGQPLDHCLRQTVIALRLADLVGADPAEREATYYLGLLMNAYCHADAAEQAEWFGDDIALKSDSYEILTMSNAQAIGFLMRRTAAHGSALARMRRVTAFPITGFKTMEGFFDTHSMLGAQFADQIGLGDAVAIAIRQAYEQWDGKGVPTHARGDEICLPSRLVQAAGPIEVFARRHGAQSARAMAARNAGSIFDPDVVAAFDQHASEILGELDTSAGWRAVIDAEPGLWRRVSGDDLDTVLLGMADLVDLKSPYLAGHSRGVASLAEAAARVAGASVDDQRVVRRAGYIHDLGRLGVSNSVWDKAAGLSETEQERVRLHPYLTEKMLARVDSLRPSIEVATRHHERLDGSGYPHRLPGSALGPLDRLLAVADAYHAMTEPRPHRPALSADEAARVVKAELRAGRLDGDAVNAVLAAAGHRAAARREGPAGLTAREVEVLSLLARGLANKEIARRLGVTPKTVSNHVEHVYAKISVQSRAAATLYVTQHGLVGSYEPRG